MSHPKDRRERFLVGLKKAEDGFLCGLVFTAEKKENWRPDITETRQNSVVDLVGQKVEEKLYRRKNF